MSHRKTSIASSRWRFALLAGFALLAALPFESGLAARPKIKITQAAWFPKTQTLKIKAQNAGSVSTAELYDINGRRLARSACKRLNSPSARTSNSRPWPAPRTRAPRQ